jgi:hypothetical protein
VDITHRVRQATLRSKRAHRSGTAAHICGIFAFSQARGAAISSHLDIIWAWACAARRGRELAAVVSGQHIFTPRLLARTAGVLLALRIAPYHLFRTHSLLYLSADALLLSLCYLFPPRCAAALRTLRCCVEHFHAPARRSPERAYTSARVA